MGHVTGHVVLNVLSILPSFLIILIPAALLFDGLMQNGAKGWTTVAWVTLLGLWATLPIGIIIGSLAPSVQKVGTWGMFPVLVLVGISGIFFPIQDLWGWVQTVAQIFPMYWVGLGMRSAFLPDAAAALEIGGSWRTLETVLVLSTWAVVGSSSLPWLFAGWRVADRAPRSRQPGSRPFNGSGDRHGSQPDRDASGRARSLPPQLSEALGVHYQTIGYLERGEYSPSLFLALRIAEYFEVPIEVVFSTEPFARIGSETATG